MVLCHRLQFLSGPAYLILFRQESRPKAYFQIGRVQARHLKSIGLFYFSPFFAIFPDYRIKCKYKKIIDTIYNVRKYFANSNRIPIDAHHASPILEQSIIRNTPFSHVKKFNIKASQSSGCIVKHPAEPRQVSDSPQCTKI